MGWYLTTDAVWVGNLRHNNETVERYKFSKYAVREQYYLQLNCDATIYWIYIPALTTNPQHWVRITSLGKQPLIEVTGKYIYSFPLLFGPGRRRWLPDKKSARRISSAPLADKRQSPRACCFDWTVCYTNAYLARIQITVVRSAISSRDCI